jgi:hypothetical protein
LGKVTNEMVKYGLLPILLTFIIFYLHIILFFMLYPNPKVLTTLQVVDFRRLKKSRGETLEQGSTFLVCFYIFVACTDPFRVFQEKLRASLNSFSRS